MDVARVVPEDENGNGDARDPRGRGIPTRRPAAGGVAGMWTRRCCDDAEEPRRPMSELLAATPLVSAATSSGGAAALAGVALRTPLLPAPWLSDAGRRGPAEVREPAGRRRVQDPRRLHGAGAAAEAARAPRRHRLLVGQPRAGRGARGAAVRRARRRRHADDGAGREGRRCAAARRGSGARGHDVAGPAAAAEAIAAEQGSPSYPAFDHPTSSRGRAPWASRSWRTGRSREPLSCPSAAAACQRHRRVREAARPEVRVIGVEPDTADAMKRSLARATRDHRAVAHHRRRPHARAPGRPHLRARARLVDDIVRRRRRHPRRDASRCWRRASSSSSSPARPPSRRCWPAPSTGGRTVAVVLSGGNLDPARAARAAGAELAAQSQPCHATAGRGGG
jgi:hypothetical protein